MWQQLILLKLYWTFRSPVQAASQAKAIPVTQQKLAMGTTA